MKQKGYLKEMLVIGLPITLQSIFEASFSLIDQLMVGSLGTISIAGSGLGSKFSSLVFFTISSISAVTSILIAQYYGNHEKKNINKSFFSCLYIALAVALVFVLPSVFCPKLIMGIYSTDTQTVTAAAEYLQIIGISFLPMAASMICSSLLRSVEKSKYPMYASVLSLFANVLFNYVLIFGKLGFPQLGLVGAALGTLLARMLESLVLLVCLLGLARRKELFLAPTKLWDTAFYKKISVMMVPLLVTEFSWSIGENIYAVVYGRLGTNALAAMTLTNPLQGLFIGMFVGVSSAATVMVGKRLGANQFDEAYDISKFLVKIGLVGALITSGVLAAIIPYYIRLFNVEAEVAQLAIYIVYALALVLFAKITNMVLAGGVLRSGGNTKYTLIIDTIGTWVFGVPLALVSAFVFHLPVYLVYFILSLEEVVRVALSVYVFRSKKWMRTLTQNSGTALL